jgi:hypothetical protein
MSDSFSRSSATGCGRLARLARSSNVLASMVGSSQQQHEIMVDECVDAVPKKRGPKTDVLEALLKRVDGLEKRLKDEKKSTSPNTNNEGGWSGADKESSDGETKSRRPTLDTQTVASETAVYSPSPLR